MGNSSVDKLLHKNNFQSDSTMDSSSIKSSCVNKLATKNSLQSDSILDNSSMEPSYMDKLLTKKTLQSDYISDKSSIKSSSVDKLATKNSTPVNKSPKQTSPNRPAKKFHTRVYNFQNGLHNNATKKSAEKTNPELLTKNYLQSDSILEKSSMKHSSAEKLASKNSLKSDSAINNASTKTFKNYSSKGNLFI